MSNILIVLTMLAAVLWSSGTPVDACYHNQDEFSEGEALYHQGKLIEARNFYLKQLQLMEKTLDPTNRDSVQRVVVCLTNLAMLHDLAGARDEAKFCLERAARLRRKQTAH